jgi:hypothetical protein
MDDRKAEVARIMAQAGVTFVPELLGDGDMIDERGR